LFLTDCCRSGALADALQASKCGLKFGALAAATSGEDSTGNWTFTQAVIDCLAGHNYADFNKDGVITFAEMGTYVKDEMKLMEGQVASVISGNGFDSQMKIAKVVFEREVIPERVEVKFDGDWWKAKLLERRGQKGLVQWFEIGWDAPEDDTWVPLQNIRPIRGGTARGAAARVASPDIASKYSVNQKIQVLSDGEYYPAVVRKVDDQRYFIHYDDYDTSSDEWVGVDRIKFKSNKVASSQSGTTSARQVDTPKFSVNQKVRVLSEGEYYPAVVKKIGGNRFLVHYDGYDASDDEWVGVKRIKLKATQK
jgi:hypothetical protein